MTIYGADLDGLMQLRLRISQLRILSLTEPEVTEQRLRGSWWAGPDREATITASMELLRPLLLRVASAFEVLESQIGDAAQRQASASDPSGAGLGPVCGPGTPWSC